MKLKIIDAFDYILLVCVLVLTAAGIAFIYSSAINSDGVLVTNEYVKQTVWASIGIVLIVITALYDYRKTTRYAYILYAALAPVLLYTVIFGRHVNGANSWIGIGHFGIQPSEFGKIIFILFLAKYLSESAGEVPLKRFLIAAAIFALPVLLILAQPDLGTASVYIPVFLVMCFMAGIPLRYILFVFAVGMGTIFLTVLPVWNDVIAHRKIAVIGALTDIRLRLLLIAASLSIALIGIVVRRYLRGQRYFYWISYGAFIVALSLFGSYGAGHVLKEYQISRLIVFLDPSVDPRGSGWNIIQSKIAIGAGGIFGRSFLHGTQSHYRFLPQQSTDFIFSILSEELGFIGGLIVFVLYGLIFFRTLKIMRNSTGYGLYIAAGILGMFFFHFFVNIGMVMGIMPITGIPLLFLSYGGSSLLTAMVAVGLLMSINYHKYGFDA
ncbi:rod shape-determining protein RodA [Treponema socranskii subsp. buccale]|uniref:rod shape-determining protein RodA n=1 Tax=Treponema socranskii TaxID=53419 RepID=UPI0020A3975E|nr:rod shape-determining protein RodA [Treponema socranskii]UTD02664.1 rod shape-determining protein RodA [Treponema socranskii subsp. buccale]